MNYKITYNAPGAPRPEPFTQHAALRRLKALGWQPRTMFDIGAFRGEWSAEASLVFPSAEYVMFEANADNEPYLEQKKFRYFIATLAGEDGIERTFHLPKAVIATGASLYRENTYFYADANLTRRVVTTTRLDSLCAAHGLNPPDLIKLDVQGAELDVLRGGQAALARCGVLIVETAVLNYNRDAPQLGDVVGEVNRLGFKCIDICEVHRTTTGVPFQLDLMFVNGALYAAANAAAGLP